MPLTSQSVSSEVAARRVGLVSFRYRLCVLVSEVLARIGPRRCREMQRCRLRSRACYVRQGGLGLKGVLVTPAGLSLEHRVLASNTCWCTEL